MMMMAMMMIVLCLLQLRKELEEAARRKKKLMDRFEDLLVEYFYRDDHIDTTWDDVSKTHVDDCSLALPWRN